MAKRKHEYDLMSDIQNIKSVLKSHFPQLEIDHELGKDEETKMTIIRIRGNMCKEREKCECFSLDVFDDHIHIDRIKYKYSEYCTMSGKEIMDRLNQSFHELKVPKVTLFDEAKVKFIGKDGKEYMIELKKYNILLYGMSWYNRFGYVSQDYVKELEHNREIRNAKLTAPFTKKIMGLCPSCNLANQTYGSLAQLIDHKLREKTGDYVHYLEIMDLVQKELKATAYLSESDKKKRVLKYNGYLEQSFL